MARAIWSGVLSFGLVSVPVELYTATEAHGPEFHQFEKGTADRIRYQRVNERTEDEVEYSDIDRVGGGVAPPPPTPPDMRARIRRFVKPSD
jgi:DNA end-binding protein Ku